MKIATSFLAGVLLIGSMGASRTVMAADDANNANDGIILKQELAPGSDYCHEKFPAIQPQTLGTDHPTVKGPGSADIIDFYGPCDESPTGKDQAWQQKLEDERRWDYN